MKQDKPYRVFATQRNGLGCLTMASLLGGDQRPDLPYDHTLMIMEWYLLEDVEYDQ